MISIDDKGIHIPVGHSLWVIDKLLREEKILSFPLFKDYCNNQARNAGIIEGSDSVDDSVCQGAFDCGIERLKYLLKLNKYGRLSEYPSTSIPNISKTFQYQENFRYRIFPEPKYGYIEYKKGKIPPCKIDESNCVKFIDKLLSSGKVFSTHALYSELEKEYCWVEFFFNKEDIVDNKNDGKIEKAELYRKCYSAVLKQCLQRIDDYLIVKDMDELLISNPCFHYKKQFDYHYAVAGTTVLNEDGKLPKLTLYDRFKIDATKYLRSEIKSMLTKKTCKEGKERYLSISEIEFLTNKIKSITDNIKEKQIAFSLKINLNIISEICTTKIEGWQERYIVLLDKIQNEFRSQENKSRPLIYADLLATYAQLLGKYGYDPETDNAVKDKWFDTICSFYNEMIGIAKEHRSRERYARYLIKYANFLRKENKYTNLEEKYSEAIHIYKQIISDRKSVDLNHDYAYALRSLSKFCSDYDRISDAIQTLTESLNYIDDSAPNAITDTLMQLAIRYAEYGDDDKVYEVLGKALSNYLIMARYNHNYYANVANVYIKLLRNISPITLRAYMLRGDKIEYETECLRYLELYEELRSKKLNTNDKIYAHALTSLSLYYLDTEQKDKAVKTCKKALTIYQLMRNNEVNCNVDIINHHFLLGRALKLPAIQLSKKDLYESKEKIQLALDFYTNLYNMMAENGQYVPSIKKGLADTNLALAETYDYLNDKGQARKRYLKAIELYSELGQNKQARDKYKELLKKAKELLRLLEINN